MKDPELRTLSRDDQARLARALMRRQGGLGLLVSAVFLALILGIPLVNAYLPEWANTPIFGFTATWLVLGVLVYPITVALSFAFVAESNRIEQVCQDWRFILGRDRERRGADR